MSQKAKKTSPNFPFFPIPNPNPNPLLCSFDIPKPIIRPPTVDSYSFLNPKPHGDATLETQTLSPLGVDPCAASRCEIVTMTTHLTVSELVGGTLGETTTVVANSNSAANSDVVVQPTMNDMVVKTFENTQMTESHLKNVQKPAAVSSSAIKKETQPLVAIDDTLDRESEKNQNDLLQNKLVDSLVSYNIPDLGKYNQSVKAEQAVGEKHMTQVPNEPLCSATLPNINPMSVSVTLAQSPNNTQKEHGELDIHQFIWCEICKVNCSSKSNFDRHIYGKRHLKNLKSSEEKLVPPSSTMPTKTLETLKPTEHEIGEIVDLEEAKTSWCDLCKVSCNTSILSTHLSGKKHMMNLQKSLKLLPDLPSNSIASVTTPPVEKLKPTKGEVVNPNEVKSLQCEVCGICCTGNEDLQKHLSGKKHQKKVNKSQVLFQPNPAPAPAPAAKGPVNKVVILDPEPVSCKRKADEWSDEKFAKRQKVVKKEEEECGVFATCKLCNVVCTSIEAFKSHLASHEHSAVVLKQVNIGSK